MNEGTVLRGGWVLGKKLGEGACAQVFEVSGPNKGAIEALVAKIIPLPTGSGKKHKEQTAICNTLNYEYMLMVGHLRDFKFSPKVPVKFYGDDNGVRFLIMERLDMDLSSLCRTTVLNNQAIASIGLQMLEGLEILHKKGFLFVDVKPENFMVKKSVNGTYTVYFIDYGMVEKFTVVSSGGGHREAAVGARGCVPGTPAFASLAVHQGHAPSRRDDIEAMCLVLLSLATGGLLPPWHTAKSDADCLKMKTNSDMSRMASERQLDEIGEIIASARSLRFDQEPDYAVYRMKLQAMERSNRSSNKFSSSSAQTSAKPTAAKKKTSGRAASRIVDDLTRDNEVVEVPRLSTAATTTSKRKVAAAVGVPLQEPVTVFRKSTRTTRSSASTPVSESATTDLRQSSAAVNTNEINVTTKRSSRKNGSPVKKVDLTNLTISKSNSKSTSRRMSPGSAETVEGPFGVDVSLVRPARLTRASLATLSASTGLTSRSPTAGKRVSIGSVDSVDGPFHGITEKKSKGKSGKR